MELGRALSQISEIHGHLTRAEVYRGLGPGPVVLSGFCAVAAAALAPRLLPEGSGLGFAAYWTTVAAISAAPGALTILFRYSFREDDLARRRTRRVIGQFAPCLAAGAAVTACLLRAEPGLAALLPGLWAVLYGLGVLAARPHLPRATGWVGLFYLAAGVTLLWHTWLPPNWGVGVTFGLGQLGAAAVLHSNVERESHAE